MQEFERAIIVLVAEHSNFFCSTLFVNVFICSSSLKHTRTIAVSFCFADFFRAEIVFPLCVSDRYLIRSVIDEAKLREFDTCFMDHALLSIIILGPLLAVASIHI